MQSEFESYSSVIYLVAALDAVLDNGKRITASYSVAEEEGREWTGKSDTEYFWDPLQIGAMDKLSRMLVEVNGEKHRIVSGTVTLTGHSDGDPASYADPAFVLEKYFGKIWRVMFRAVNPEQSETEQVEEMKQLPVFRCYPEKTLQDIAHHFWHAEIETDMLITSKLTAGGSHEITIRTGNKRFPVDVAGPYDKPGRKLELVKDLSKPESHLSYANDYYFGTEEEMELVRLVHNRDFEKYRQEMEKTAAVPMKEIIRPENFRYAMNYQFTVDHLDYDMPVVIRGNDFNFSTGCEGWLFKDEIMEMIRRRGGNPCPDSGEACRFMVVSPFATGFTADAGVGDFIRMKKRGRNARIITEHQLWKAFADTERNPLISEEEYEKQVRAEAEENKPTVVDHAAIEKRMQEAYDSARAEAEKYLDKDARIVFMDKKYVLSGFGEEKKATGAKIEKYGGIFSKNMVKDADYLVINMKTPGSSDLKAALQYRSKGSEIIIVSDDRLQQAMKETKPLSKEELEQRKQEKLQREAEQRRLQLEKSLEKMRAKYKR